MSKLLVNAPTGLQEIHEVGPGGSYFDAARVIWDERTDGTLPAITLGGMVRQGGALVFSQAQMDALLPALKAKKKAAVTSLYRQKSELPVNVGGVLIAAYDGPLMELIGAKVGAKPQRKFVTALGQKVNVTQAELGAIFAAVDDHKQLLRDREYDLYNAIDLAEDIPALNVIDITVGWPV